MKWQGIYVANITPFLAGGEVDLPAFQRHLEFLAKAGVSGFVPVGTTGESPTISLSEKSQLFRITSEFSNPRGLKVIAGCGSNDTSETLENTFMAKECGCHAALVVTPYYNRPTPVGITKHYEYIATRSPLPVIVYHIPGRTGLTLSPSQMIELLNHPNIVGMKDSAGRYQNWLALAHSGRLQDKSLLAGDDDAFAFVRACGGTGIISAAANVIPETFVKIQELCDEGRWPEAFALQTRIYQAIETLFSETNPGPVKEAARLLGFGDGSLRLPLTNVEKTTSERIRQDLAAIGAL